MLYVVQTMVRAPAVAGRFYPASPAELTARIDALLAGAAPPTTARPKALIVPHAGLVYSGPIAAAAFARIAPWAARLERIVMIGPAHRVFVDGLVGPGCTQLRTPLGLVDVDVAALAALPASAAAHAHEHSLEVELPFLQRLAPRAKVVPLIGSRAEPAVVARELERLWGGAETLIVISSDLSHFLSYDAGRARDEHTVAKILARDAVLVGDEACGAIGINGLLQVAHARRLSIELVDLRSSGDTAGRRDEVVGYGAFALYEEAA